MAALIEDPKTSSPAASAADPTDLLMTVTVTNAEGKRVDTGKPRVSGNQMSVSLSPGGAGTYHVIWRVLSVDTHTTDGSFTFQVGQ